LAINVLSGLDVIDSVDNKVEVCPEIIVEEILVFRSNSCLTSFKIDIFVHSLSNVAGSLALILSNMFSSEQKLSVEVADFNVIIISNCAFTSFGGETHQSKHLDEFAAQGSGSDHARA